MTYIYKVPPADIKRFELICKLCTLQHLNYNIYEVGLHQSFFFQAQESYQ